MKRLMLSCLLFVLPFGAFAVTDTPEAFNKTYGGKQTSNANIKSCMSKPAFKGYVYNSDTKKMEQVVLAGSTGTPKLENQVNKSNFAKDLISNHKKALKVTGGVVAGLGLAAGGYYLHTSGKAAQAWDTSKPYVDAGLEKAGVWCGQLKDLAVAAGSSLKEAIQAKLSK